MESETYGRIKFSVKKLLDIDLNAYKDEQMRRRLDSWLIRCGEASWDIYFHRLKTDSKELSRFRDYLTINVSEFFRDIDRWETLRKTIIPHLLSEASQQRGTQAGLRIWSAGCSIGMEPYSLAIILDEVARYREHTLLATDLDRGALAKATAGGPYLSADIRNVTPAERVSYFEPGGPPFYVRKHLTQKILFREGDLIADQFENGFDLIVCRNVIIYFTAEAKAALYRKLHAALRPGGVLFLGGTEIIPRPQEIGLDHYGISFYVRTR